MSNEATHYVGRGSRASQVLQPSTTVSADGSGNPVAGLGEFRALTFELDVTAAGSLAGDKLDVFVQTTVDSGTNWVDVAHFTQVLGNGGAKRYFAKLQADVAMAEFENATALAAASQRALFGDQYRVRWAVTDGGGTKTFTFSVSVNLQG
jgi:hypothetical protein